MSANTFAKLLSIDFAKLMNHDPSEIAKLTKAATEDGFFYLDLSGPATQELLRDWKSILPILNGWFDLPLEEKMKHHHGTVLHGYTPIGSYAGVAEGTKDGNETIKVTGQAFASPELLPSVISSNMGLFRRYNCAARRITLEVLSCFSDALSLTDGARLENFHHDGAVSSSCLNLIRYQRSPDEQFFGQNKHTDNGTLTLLLTSEPGLQILDKDSNTWENVAPKENHAIVNVADTLRFLSDKRFRSSVHRAVPIWSEGQTYRNSIGYFLRAEDSAMLQGVGEGGKAMTAKEWHDRKYINYKASHDVQKTNSILLGGMEVREAITV